MQLIVNLIFFSQIGEEEQHLAEGKNTNDPRKVDRRFLRSALRSHTSRAQELAAPEVLQANPCGKAFVVDAPLLRGRARQPAQSRAWGPPWLHLPARVPSTDALRLLDKKKGKDRRQKTDGSKLV